MAKVGRNALVACPDCDALQHEPEAGAEFGSACWRCDAFLGPTQDERLDRVFALAVTALVAYGISLSYPLMTINIQGNGGVATLMGATRDLWTDGMQPVAALVFCTTVLVPGIDLLALVYLLGGLYLCDRGWRRAPPPFAVLTLRVAQFARSWSMLEVFMLGTLGAVVRMARESSVHIGRALWSCAVLIRLIAALETTVHPRALWSRLESFGAVP
jgi:paraquat-inducible protein A